MNEILILLFLLLFKHYIADFILQSKYQLLNKGTYGHLGGILHASIQMTGTILVLIFFFPIGIVLLCSVIDGLVHYHIDWSKENINKHFKFTPFAYGSSWFWAIFGMDQLLHQITYILLVILAMSFGSFF
jgi:hypothetical protein